MMVPDFYDLRSQLTAEERDVSDRVRRYCDQHVIPVINDYWERGDFPFALLAPLAELQICGGNIQGYGCPGFSAVTAGLISAELSRGDGSLSTFFTVHSSVVMGAMALLGDEEQKQRWLPAMARLEKIGAFALTEPDHGSDVVGLSTTAIRDGDSFLLTGAKRWIGNATFADYTVVWARNEEGKVGGYVVEKGTPGFEAKVIDRKISKRAVWQADITLTNVRVPQENKLAQAHSFKDTTRLLTATRFGVAWEALGHAMAAYELALDYTKTRHQFGRPLAAFQMVQHRLVGMLAKVTSMQLLCLRLSRLLEEGRMTEGQASMAKMSNCRLAREVVAEARDLFGGNGLLLDTHIGRHFVDLESVYTYEGSDSIQTLIVGREITGLAAFK